MIYILSFTKYIYEQTANYFKLEGETDNIRNIYLFFQCEINYSDPAFTGCNKYHMEHIQTGVKMIQIIANFNRFDLTEELTGRLDWTYYK